MSARNPTARTTGHFPARRRLQVGFGLGAVLVILAAFVWWRSVRKPLLPAIDLQGVDPKVAAALHRRLDDVALHPKSAPAWGWLGALLWAYDFRVSASACLTEAERLEPGNPRWPYYHALALIIVTPNRALPFLEKAVSLCGSSPAAPRFRLAHLLAEQGRWEDAQPHLEALLAAQPDFAPARLLGGRAAQHRGDLETAVLLTRGCANDPRTARSASILLAAIYRQKGDPAASDQALRRSATLGPDQLFEDPFQAEVTLLRGDPRALSEQAHPLLAAGQLNEAAALISRLQQDHADDPETWLLVGRLQLLRKDVPGAESALRRHLQMNPRSVQGLFQLGLVQLAQERWTNAAATFGQTIEIKPDFGPGHYNRGVALSRAGQPQAAIAAFRESLRYNPERVETYLFLADLQLV
ncbi:MAG: tetratricopeptide repeat protein [Verrucomicrobiota bacterium]